MLYKYANECHRGLFINHEVDVVYYFVTESKQEYRDFMGLYACVSRFLFPFLHSQRHVFCFTSTSLGGHIVMHRVNSRRFESRQSSVSRLFTSVSLMGIGCRRR